jgi:hypothetical protein
MLYAGFQPFVFETHHATHITAIRLKRTLCSDFASESFEYTPSDLTLMLLLPPGL